jgi:cellobiose phosphorylase
MAGVFHSMVTQGHVNINRFLSTTHSYLRLLFANGQRIFVELEDEWRLLDLPSAFSMESGECRWIYRHHGGMIEVRSSAPAGSHVLTLAVEILSGEAVRFLIANHVAINGDDGSSAVPADYEETDEGIFVRAVPDCDVGRRFPGGGFRITFLPGTVIEAIGRDEMLFADGGSRNQPYVCMVTAPALAAGLNMHGCLIREVEGKTAAAVADPLWKDIAPVLAVAPPAASPLAGWLSRLQTILPWYIQNAFIHYLAPRGLEQYSGGGWGVRDVCQGPVELLLALGRVEPIRDLLIRVFRTQNPDGDWPQWFMFFERERAIRPGDSHGDIVFWPLLALAQYLIASGDAELLAEQAVFFHPEGDAHADRATVWQHVERALAVISARVIRGTRLAAYGHGDWNDSLQPVQPAMRERLCSSWTVTLHYQTLTTLAAALRGLGLVKDADRCDAMAAGALDDFRRLLLVDEVLAGFAFFQEDGTIEYLLHPRDRTTGLSYSLLPMIHAITNDLLTPQQARAHLRIIREHLIGPDGARLFDRPVQYRGGIQRYFQRAESTSFFGRENGLMYTHAHLRYAEALAHYGDADGFFEALCQANPVGMKELVPPAALRQANCYYSSSDAAFADRYQAYAEYEKVMKGGVPLEGGWRVYSSGAGIATGLIMRCLFGVRQGKSELVLDPVIPNALDGLRVRLKMIEHLFEVLYRSAGTGCGPAKVMLNGCELPFTRDCNPYRTGAARISLEEIRKHLTAGVNRLEVYLG